MIINWGKRNIKIIPLTSECSKAIKVMKKNKIILLPGNNDIPDDAWNEVKKYKNIQKSIEAGFIIEKEFIEKEVEKEIEEENEKGEKVKKKIKVKELKGKSFKDLDDRKARKMIEDTFDIATLEKWREAEGRADIRNLIDDKIKEIKDYKVDPNIGKEK